MNGFDRRAALWAALGMFFLVELLGLFAGIKECGFGGEAPLISLSLVLIVYFKLPVDTTDICFYIRFGGFLVATKSVV